MEATRRQSVSELNLEEILLAMADSDTPQQTTSHSSVKPRPLPTPQARSRAQTGPPLPEPSVHYPTNEYHSPYPVDPGHNLPPAHDPYYTSGYPEQPQQAMYQYEAANYMYQQDPSLSNMYQQDPSQPDMYQQDPSQPMYYGNEQEYSYAEGYPYLPEQGYGEYYQEYGYPYYVPEQAPAGYPEYYYPYEYSNQDYPPQDYPYAQQQYYAEAQPVVSGYEAATATPSNFSTTRRPLPRLPPKKQRQDPTPGHDLTFGTPSIDSSHHLGLHQRKEVDTASHVQPQPQPTIHPQVQPQVQQYAQHQAQVQPPIQHQTQVPIQPPVQAHPQPPPKPVERHTAHLPPPPQRVPEPLSKEEEVDSPENLAAIMADISLQFSERAQPPSKSSASSQAQSFRDHESSRTSRSQSYRENDSHYPPYPQDHGSNRPSRSQSFKEDESHYTSHPPSFQDGHRPPSQIQSFREDSNQHPSHSQSFREEDHPPTRGQTLNQGKFHSAPESLDTPQATAAPPIPGSPAPPPRLSKQAAALRLSNGSSYASSPSFGTPSRDSRTQSVSAHSNLSHTSQAHGSSKPVAKVVANARGFKKGPSRLTSSKPQNAVQLLGLSKPVTDSDADGFDFDETDFESVDQAVLAMSIPPDCSLEQLVREHLTPNLRADWARIRAIFIWIVENIRYDSQLVPVVRGPSPNVNMVSSSDGSGDEGSNSTPSVASDDELGDDEYLETPKAVLHRRACRQHGFANLFRAMCASAGLECEIVTGYLKDPNDLSELNKIPEANHSWICVKIQGYYRFIDCGLSVSSHPCNVQKKTDLFYFLTNPSKLIYTHFPTNKGHQYLRPAIPFSSFALLPFATDVYFDYGIRFLDLPEGILTIHEDQTGEINLSIPEDMKCWGEVEVPDPSGRGVRRLPALVQCRTKEDGRVAKVMIRIKGKCNSALLRFRCGYPQDGKALSYCFSLRLAHTGSKAPEEFVKILPSPVEFFLIVPLNFDLLYNIAYRFHVLPGAVESRHFKLALRSPSMKIHKFVYYPGDQGYIANVTLRERGQWAISYMVRSKEERPSKREPWINVACYRCI